MICRHRQKLPIAIEPMIYITKCHVIQGVVRCIGCAIVIWHVPRESPIVPISSGNDPQLTPVDSITGFDNWGFPRNIIRNSNKVAAVEDDIERNHGDVVRRTRTVIHDDGYAPCTKIPVHSIRGNNRLGSGRGVSTTGSPLTPGVI